MNQFIVDYIDRLKRLSSDDDLVSLYHWFWDNQDEISRTVDEINRELRLEGEFALKPDLPCQSIGSRKGLLFLLVNPGWNPELNSREDAYCRRSKEDYVDLMFNFFERYPEVAGRHIRSVSRMISLTGVLDAGVIRFGQIHGKEAKWQRAQESGLLGHWELFPFHSKKDGITRFAGSVRWLSTCFRESALAALRCEPECVLAMSGKGWGLLRNDCLRDFNWRDDVLGSKATRLSYCVVSGRTRKTEVVALATQLRSPACTDDVLFEAVNRLRQVGDDAVPATTSAGTTFDLRGAPEPRESPEAQTQVPPHALRQRATRYYRRKQTGHHYVPRPNSQTELIERHLTAEWKSAEQIQRDVQGEGSVIPLARIRQHLDWHTKRGRIEGEERPDPPHGLP